MAVPLTRLDSSALTREELDLVLHQPLVQANIVLSSGVQIREAPTAVPLKIPKLSSVPLSDWYAEGKTIDDSEAVTSYLTLLPANLKSVKTWLPMSSEVIRNSPLGFDDVFRSQLVFSVSRTLEQAFLNGDNTPDTDGNITPQGILRWSGIHTIDKAAAEPTLDDFAEMITLLENSFATPAVWMMSPSMWNVVRTKKDTLERYQLNPQPTGDTVRSLWGIPVKTSVYLADAPPTPPAPQTSSIILADPNYIIVARDNAPEARLFQETLAKSDEIALRVTTRMDIGPIWPQAVAVMKNAAETA